MFSSELWRHSPAIGLRTEAVMRVINSSDKQESVVGRYSGQPRFQFRISVKMFLEKLTAVDWGK
jgi:hypothetical protein